MSKESQNHINYLAGQIEIGEWKTAIDVMAKDGMAYDDIMAFCDSINFYPDNNFCAYARKEVQRRSALKDINDFFGRQVI
jgi:hypothetical protein